MSSLHPPLMRSPNDNIIDFSSMQMEREDEKNSRNSTDIETQPPFPSPPQTLSPNHSPKPTSILRRSPSPFPITSPPAPIRPLPKPLIPPLFAYIGSCYEWFDFGSFAVFSPEIGSSFFPGSPKSLQLTYTLLIYTVSFLLHPLGGVIFGEIGDNGTYNLRALASRLTSTYSPPPPSLPPQTPKILLRKYSRNHTKALYLSFTGVLFPTLCMILIPTYQTFGRGAQVLLILTRILQGISVGGQSPGCHVLAISIAPLNRRGFRGSVCHAAAATGFLAANVVGYGVRWRFEGWEERWRCAWVAGMFLIVPMLVCLRGTERENGGGRARKESQASNESRTQGHGGFTTKGGKNIDGNGEGDGFHEPPFETLLQASTGWGDGTGKVPDVEKAHTPFLFNIVKAGFVSPGLRAPMRTFSWESKSRGDDNTIAENKGEGWEGDTNNNANSTPSTTNPHSLSFLRVFDSKLTVRQFIGHILSCAGLSACFNLLIIFVPAYISGPAEIVESSTGGLMSMSVLVYYIIMTLYWGSIVDSLPPRSLPVAMGLTGAISAVPFLLLSIETRVPSIIWSAEIVFATFLSFGYAGVASWQVELWSSFPRVSYSGVAVCHNIAASAFGGTLPFLGMIIANKKIETHCTKWRISYLECNELLSKSRVFPLFGTGCYVLSLGFVSLLSLLLITRHPSEFDVTDTNVINPKYTGKRVPKVRPRFEEYIMRRKGRMHTELEIEFAHRQSQAKFKPPKIN